VNASQEPAQPHQTDQPFADPTAEPPLGTGTGAGAGTGAGTAGGMGVGSGVGTGAGVGAGAGVGQGAPGFGGAGDTVDAGGDGHYGLAHPGGPHDPYGPTEAGYPEAGGWEQPQPPRRPWRRTVLVAVLSAVAILVLGGPLGLIWTWLAPSVPVLDAGQGGIVVNDPSPEEYIAADGWYTLLGFGFGLLVAIVAWLVLRRDRGPVMLLGVVLGTLGAGYLIGPWIGGLIGKSGYRHWQETAAQGATYFAPPQVHSVGPKLVPAFAAAIVLTLLAGWSNDPELDEPGAKPGYGPNAALHESEAGA
jgi:hypothetical protein